MGRATVDWLDLVTGCCVSRRRSRRRTEHLERRPQRLPAYILREWVAEREQYSKYTDSNRVWLTKYGNPYNAEELNRLLRTRCEQANIPVQNKDGIWYSIRHSVSTSIARDNGLATAQAQLRHKSERTTIRCDQTPIEDRKRTLNTGD